MLPKCLSLIFINLIFSSLTLFSQNAQKNFAIRQGHNLAPKLIPQIVLPAIDTIKLLQEDQQNGKNVPYRDGYLIDVKIDIHTSGKWDTLANGDKIWRMSVLSKQAYALDFIFDKFYLPEGTLLLIYNQTSKYHLGPFSSSDNRPDSLFATAPLNGDNAIFEYYEPKTCQQKPFLSLAKVGHTYKKNTKSNQSFGSSRPCEINVNCPEGQDWQNQKRAVVKIRYNQGVSKYNCSGALINNTKEDKTPYVLTANHCNIDNLAITFFNYESLFCNNPNEEPPLQYILGATTIAKNTYEADFRLIKLSQNIPDEFDAYFAGWDISGNLPSSTTTIHHPSGDIKKISKDFDAPEISISPAEQIPAWHIKKWDLGATEAGSSGSPLFDNNKRIIGQLYGGASKCGNPIDDYYGRLSISWQPSTQTNEQLKYWLDPIETNTQFINGINAKNVEHNLDAGILSIKNIHTYVCTSSIQPEVIVKNNGQYTLTSLKINYQINNNTSGSITWNGNLANQEITSIALPNIDVNPNLAQQTFKVVVTEPNGATDQNPLNDTMSINFQYNKEGNMLLELQTDNYANEITWEITKLDNFATVMSKSSYPNNSLIKEQFCLSPGCYKFTIKDSEGDGLSGNGYFVFKDQTYNVELLKGSNFGRQAFVDFSINNICKEFKDIEIDNISLYPNPTDGFLTIKMNKPFDKKIEASIYNTVGQKMIVYPVSQTRYEATFDCRLLKPGLYILYFRLNDLYYQRKFFIAN